MTEIINGLPGSVRSLFASAERTRIAQLDLGQPAESDSFPCVEAVVSLVWPYSNKDRILSLLLAEPDVRLRSAKGQLKVTFHGAGARQVAKSQVGIGDIVLLRIEGAKWEDTGSTVLTPGKKLEWDLHFKNRVVLEVRRSGSHLATIDYEGTDTPPPALEGPKYQNAKSQKLNGYHDDSLIAFSTPASVKSKRISSGSFIDGSLDPFAGDDGFVVGKGRKRTKFSRTSGSWRLVGEGETSEHEEDLRATSEEAVAQAIEDTVLRLPTQTYDPPEVIVLDDDPSPATSPVEASMPPPLAPIRRPPEKPGEASPQTEHIKTPRLHPLVSPDLPMVSPLARNGENSASYFDVQTPAPSELDAISVPSTSPQEEMIHWNPAAEENIDDGLPEVYKQSIEDAELPHSERQPDSASNYVGRILPISSSATFEAQSAFSNSIAASPFGSGSSGFAGFGSQPKSAFPSTAFGTGTTDSPFAVPLTSSGNDTSFASFGNPSGFGVSRAIGAGVGFGFGTPATTTSSRRFAGFEGQLGPRDVLDDALQDQPLQEMEAAVDQGPMKSSTMQNELDTFRDEPHQSEDDDMYGPARPARSSPSMASVRSGRSGSMHQNGQELFHVTAFDVDAGKLPSLVLPIAQDRNSNKRRDRRRSQQSPFLDGASDILAESESESESSEHDIGAQISSEPVSTPIYSETCESVEPVQVTDLEVVYLDPLTNAESNASFDSVTRAQIAVGPILELQGVPVPQTQAEQLATVQATKDEDKIRTLETTELELEEPESKHAAEQNAIGRPQASEDVSELDGDEARAIQEQLLTPDNTQRDVQDEANFESLRQVPSEQMPPTPDNTQEPGYADVLQLDGTDESRSFEQKEDNLEVSLSPTEQNQKILSRPSRPSLNVAAVSSPYFIARKSPLRSPERQMENTSIREPEEEVDQERAIEHTAQDLLVRESAQTAALSRRHMKRLQNMLGMATPISYYTPLPNLDEHYSHQIDVLAICTADSGAPTRSMSGPKDYNISLYLTDFFLEGTTTVTAQLFRPYKEALPVVHRGEVILLRSFKVQSQKHKMMLLSTDSSAWAVFSLSKLSAKDAEYWDLQVHVPGPPVEYGSEEHVYAKRLMEWWEAGGDLGHTAMTAKIGDRLTHPRTQKSLDRADVTGDISEHLANGTINGLVGADNFQPVDPPRTTRSSRRINNHTDNMENNEHTREGPVAAGPTLESVSPTTARTTRSSRHAADRVDNTDNGDDPASVDIIGPVPEIASPKAGRRTRRSTSILSATPELARSLRSQSAVHELRDGTKYVDGHVPTKKDGVHQLRDGTTYVDENMSPTGRTPNLREKSVVHELRDGTNYVDRSKSPEVRRSARNKRGGSLVHELRDGSKYTDE